MQLSALQLMRLFQNRLTLLLTFSFVHAVFFVVFIRKFLGGVPHEDVTLYSRWAFSGLETGTWPGLDIDWVYPIGALGPIMAAAILGKQAYFFLWFAMTSILNLATILVLTRDSKSRGGWLAAYFWLSICLIMGPLVFSRIEGIAGPLVVIGLAYLSRQPVVAAALLAVATWIKVWPAAVVVALLIASRKRVTVFFTGLAVSAAFAAVVLVKGGGEHLFSFWLAQGNRGMQLEAPLITTGLWNAILHRGDYVYVNYGIQTLEIWGPTAEAVVPWPNPLLAICGVVIAATLILAQRRGADAIQLLLCGSMCLVGALIVFNKVGSPQYMLWFAAIVAAGLALDQKGWRVHAVIVLVLCVLTTLVYLLYEDLYVNLSPGVALILTIRNVLVVALFAVSLWQVFRLARKPRGLPVRGQPTADPAKEAGIRHDPDEHDLSRPSNTVQHS
ncbi:DUF2029 domain-containing protein [Pseudarthrobacter sp. RMG13]|uniref:DUF2029 domain-containing protein n=1 Tax=Pseudarthrobacter humi TaxID=2952523 RepID=A0ABT1LKN2_9MICC|nr:glycosyltransferase 87 family protein [Pseudarthrobacter humi]MCP8998656.1 DUF2029 domain-containing protein [Pseudarthrobacter humi]